MPDAEFLYVNCTCEGGMRNGLRCADCGGRGIVSKGTQITGAAVNEPAATTEDGNDGLEDLSVTNLRTRAKDLGLPQAGTKAELVARIRSVVHPDGTGEDPLAAGLAALEDAELADLATKYAIAADDGDRDATIAALLASDQYRADYTPG